MKRCDGFVALLLTAKFDFGKTRADLFRDNPRFVAKIALVDRIQWFPGDKSGIEDHAWYVWGAGPGSGSGVARLIYEGRTTEASHSEVASGWSSTAVPPPRPMMVDLFFANLPVVPEVMTSERDVRRQLGFWDGDEYCDLFTGHSFSDPGMNPYEFPTHWRRPPSNPERSA